MTSDSHLKGRSLFGLFKSDQASSTLSRFFANLQPSPEIAILLMAVLIGIGAGAGVVILRFLIHTIHRASWGNFAGFLSTWGHWTLALIPLIGGMIIGLMRWQLKDFGPGLTTLIEMVLGGKTLLPVKPVTKMLAAAISLGSGASLGPEGPSVEIGANLSLLLGQVLKVSQERQRLLLAAGAAAGLAAGFNAPIAGVFFALEVVLGTTFANSAVSVVVLAAVIAAWLAQIGLGYQPAFSLPAYEVRSLLEFPLYVGLGAVASLVSVVYKKSMTIAQRSFQGQVEGLTWLSAIPVPLHPVLGGACVGLMALWYPQILGVGYETIESILQDVQFPLRLVLTLLLTKLVMTAISFGSGFVGGVFAPALFLGASLGSAYGKVMAIAFPALSPYIASPPAYAMVGMAAVLAGTVRAPLTSILLLFELTHDYRIVLPLMGAVGLTVWIIERIQPSLVLDSNGQQQDSSPPDAAAQLLIVADAMQPSPLILSSDLPLLIAAQTLIEQRHHCALVLTAQGDLSGILTLQDVNRLITNPIPDADQHETLQQPIGQLCTSELLVAYDDEPLEDAIARMSTRGLHQLPVLRRESAVLAEPPQAEHLQPHAQRVVGLLTPEDALLACSALRTRLAIMAYQQKRSSDNAVEPEPIVEPPDQQPVNLMADR